MYYAYCMYVCMYALILYMYVVCTDIVYDIHMRVYIHTYYMQILFVSMYARISCMYVFMAVCMYTYMYVCMHTY